MRLFLTLLVASVVALSGCGGDDDDSGQSTGANAGDATTQTAPSTSAETTPAETTETEDQGSDDSGSDDSGSDDSGGTSAGGSGQDDQSGGSDDSGSGDSGSGGTSSGGGEQAASAAVTGFYAALSSGDGDKACALMGDAVKAQFTKALAQSQNKQGASCATLAAGIAKSYPEQVRQRLTRIKVTKVTVDGDKATVTAKLQGAPAQTLPLVLDGGNWKIQAPVGAGTP